MALYDVPAPAKLNLFLHVTGRRPDGYHTLQTVFRFIDLCDHLDFDVRSDGRIEREGATLPGLAAEDDLIVRAARALQDATGTSLGAQIRCRKNIPSGAGLGGGSSDAATTLIALNRLWKTGLDREALTELAKPLGADVPVFVFGRPAFAQGRGDEMTELALPDRTYLVLRPYGSVSTAEIFSAPDLTRDSKPVIISVFTHWQTARVQQEADSQQHAAAESGGQYGNRLFGRNDLEPVVLARYESIRQMADGLRKQGFHARMTGSGSCFFVEFNTQHQASRARQEISSKMLEGRSEGHVGPGSGATASHRSTTAVVENTWVCPGLSDHPLWHW